MCESRVDVVTENAIAVGEDYHDVEHIEKLARNFGQDIPEHSCDSEDDDEVDCSCGCQSG